MGRQKRLPLGIAVVMIAIGAARSAPPADATDSSWNWKQYCEGRQDGGAEVVLRAGRRFSCTNGVAEVRAEGNPKTNRPHLVDAWVRCLEGDYRGTLTFEWRGCKYRCSHREDDPTVVSRDAGSCDLEHTVPVNAPREVPKGDFPSSGE